MQEHITFLTRYGVFLSLQWGADQHGVDGWDVAWVDSKGVTHQVRHATLSYCLEWLVINARDTWHLVEGG